MDDYSTPTLIAGFPWLGRCRARTVLLTPPAIIFYARVNVRVCEMEGDEMTSNLSLQYVIESENGRIPPFKEKKKSYSLMLKSWHLPVPWQKKKKKKVFLPFHLWLRVYSGSSVKMMDDKLNLCLGSEGELWQSDLSWEWRVRVRRNWAPQGTRHWQIHPARRISEAFCFESWLLTSDPHPSSCQPLKDASPCQGSSAPLILVIHFPDRPRPVLSRRMKQCGWNIYFCTAVAHQI